MKEGILKKGLGHLRHNMTHYWTFLWLGIFSIFLGLVVVFPINLNFGKRFLYGLGVIIILGSLLKPKKSKENKNETNETVKIPNLDPSEVDFIKRIFEENWRHARHVENERMWFTYIYAAIIAATLTFLVTKDINLIGDNRILLLPILFLILFSFIGCLAITKLNIEYHNFKEHALAIIEECHLRGLMAKPRGREMEKSE
ncbi:MAG: hypothetical protein U9O85_07845 [Euryarchaeota archaeon]|nr:hypothetical protein [Euryarchaeota archaeon]